MSSERSYLRRGSLVLIAIGVGGFLADYAFNVGLSHLLEPHDFGDFRVGSAFATLCGVLVVLGGERAAPKVLAGPLERGESARVWEYLRFYFQLSLLLSLVVIGLTWAASYLHLYLTDAEEHHVIAWFAFGVPFYAAGALASRGLQSARHPALAALPWRVGAPVLGLSLVLLAAWLREGVTTVNAVVIVLGVVGAITLWQWTRMRRLALPELRRDPTARMPRAWLSASVPMMGVFVVSLALNQSDLYFLEILGDERQVGFYAAAATTAHFLLLIQTSVVGIVAPLAQPAMDAGLEASRALRHRGERMMLAGIVPATVLVVLGARPILSTFGPGYADASAVLGLLAAGNATWSLAALSTLWLQYSGRGMAVVAVSIATLVVDSTLNVLLIPRFGMVGAAAGTAMTTTLAATAIVLTRRRIEALRARD